MAKASNSPVGDVIFFLVLLFTASLGYSLCTSFFSNLERLDLSDAVVYLVSLVVGWLIGVFFIRGYLSVFIHECKHMIVSLLAGNSPRGIKIRKDSGHYEYAYTEETESYNAFISLAPYYLPLFSTILLGSALYPLWGQESLLKMLLCLGYGTDLSISLRDIAPHQTDFSNLRGGFGLGIVYVASLHIIMLISVICWVFGDLETLAIVFQEAFRLFMGNQSLQ